MIKVNCVVNSADEKNPKDYLCVNSIDNQYNSVEIHIEGHVIAVYADDIIQAVENCRSNGIRRPYPYRSYKPVEDEE